LPFLLLPFTGGSSKNDVLEGCMEGRRPRGSKHIGMLEELKDGSFMIMKRRAENREAWRIWGHKTCR